MAYTLLRIVYTIAGGAKENGYNTSQSKPDNEKTILSTPSILSYESVQVKPTFKGGTITEFAQWVEDMMEGSNVSGNVIIEFTVNVYGGVRNVVVKGAGKKTNDKIMNIVRFSPNWAPGKNRGKVVPVRCRTTLSFGN